MTPVSPRRATNRVDAFRHAFRGWWYVIRTQQNAWIHAVASIAATVIALWLRLSIEHWALLLLAMAIVWVAEFFNTAVETVVDLASPEIHPLARIAKDVAAAAVFVSAGGAALVGLLLLGPPLLERVLTLARPLLYP